MPGCLFFFLCLFLPPAAPLVPDGQGGWVPVTNSQYDPVTGEFLPPDNYVLGPDGRVYLVPPPPAYPEPQGHVEVLPSIYQPVAPATRRVPRKPAGGTGKPCYGSDGHWIGENNPECQTTQ